MVQRSMSTDSITEVERLRAELSNTHADLAFLAMTFRVAEAAVTREELAEAILNKLAEYVGTTSDGGFVWLGDTYPGKPGLIHGDAPQQRIDQLVTHLPQQHEGSLISVVGGDHYLIIPVREPDREPLWGVIALPLQKDVKGEPAQLATTGSLGIVMVINLRRLDRESRLLSDAQRAEAALRGKLDLAEPSRLIDGLGIVGEEFGPQSGFSAFAAILFDEHGAPTACAGDPVGFTEREALELAKEFKGLQEADQPGEKSIAVPVKLGNDVAALLLARDDEGINEVDRNVLAGLATAISSSVNRRDARLEVSRVRSDVARQLIAAQERERAKIAADIHDDVIQQLSATAMRLELVLERIKRGSAKIDDIAVVVQEETAHLRQAVADTRSLLMDIRPQVLDDNGLMPALQELARRVPGIKVDVEYAVAGDVDPDIAISVFRITQEALSNVRKHAQATEAHVHLAEQNGQIVLQVRDDGVGYEASKTGPSESGSHFGLLGMRERVRMHGGHFLIQGAAGEGTTLRVDLPKAGVKDA